MMAATDGRRGVGFLQRFRLRTALFWALGVLVYVLALSFYKQALLDRHGTEALHSLKERHARVMGLFHSSYYFFREEQFVPGVKELLQPVRGASRIHRVVILSAGGANRGEVLYDSDPAKSAATALFRNPAFLTRLEGVEPTVYSSGFSVAIAMPAAPYAAIYFFDADHVRTRVLASLIAGVLAALLLGLFATRARLRAAYCAFAAWKAKYWRLRARFIFVIVLLNAVTASIVFFSLVSLQTREQSERIEKESVLFSQFSTGQIISDFTNYFYFYYNDRFVPEIRRIVATNPNLLGIRVISQRTRQVLFDSEQASFLASVPVEERLKQAAQAEFPPALASQLPLKDLLTHISEERGDRELTVITTYRNENQEPLFWVEYRFSFDTLKKSIQAIRRQILLDLIPSLAIGVLLAMVFVQLLISPIRRLVAALHRVTSGDYEASVQAENTDEVGDLVHAFNTMTAELRKKGELRKYLSDSTYRQIMAAPDSPEGFQLGGSKVAATVLFADIRNFVGHCESLEAEEVTAMLNEYFSEMVEVVYKHGGEVDKFIGDALLAVFYAEEETATIRRVRTSRAGSGMSGTTAALQAIYCALEMRERLAEFNRRRKALNKNVIEIGVGLSHGEIISGPIGAKDRMDFTVIGDVVNLASRIEKLSKLGVHTKIVFSNHIEEKVRGLLDYHELSTDKIRGKEEDVRVFELIGIRDIDTLVGNLKSGDAPLRRRSVELLGQSRNLAALPHAIQALDDGDEEVQLNAVVAVSKLAPRNDVAALDALFRCVWANRSGKLVASAVSAIGRLCSTERVLELAPLLNSSDERLVANTIEAMGQARSGKATDLILPKLTSVNNRIKANAAMAIFASGRLEVIDTLKPMLLHSQALMRSSAAFALGELTVIAAQEQLSERWKAEPEVVKLFLAELQDCVPMLVALLRDPDLMVKRQALIALGKIKDKSAVLPIIEMVDPKTGSRDLIRDVTVALRSIGSHSLVREVISRLSSKGP